MRVGGWRFFRGGWASGPWVFDLDAAGFYLRTGSGLINFVAGFVTEGFQFLKSGELFLVAEMSI